MDQLHSYADQRLISGCVHCGRMAEGDDHVPSRVLLDEPYPENLPVVPSCTTCNTGFSLDEEYLACLIECARAGGVEAVRRPKIKRILEHSPALVARLHQARRENLFGDVEFVPELPRVSNVLVKLARGHAAFELSQPLRHAPDSVRYAPLCTLKPEAIDEFEGPPDIGAGIWPEVGSRAMQRLVVSQAGGLVIMDWITVQEGQYRYLATASSSVVVRIVIGEYLACEVVWDELYP